MLNLAFKFAAVFVATRSLNVNLKHLVFASGLKFDVKFAQIDDLNFQLASAQI
nr:hypothetical protein [uncultured Campylobacter sp.]